MWDERRFLSFDETAIFYRRLRPAAVRASAVIVHGMGEHGGRYHELAEFLSGLGLEVWVPDLRGFGKSGGPRVTAVAGSVGA